MRFIALIAWFVAALWGLYMLAVWLIENDATNQRNSASRLPLPVIVAHVTLAVSGLVVWVTYLLLDRAALACPPWASWAASRCSDSPCSLAGSPSTARRVPCRSRYGCR